MWFLNGTALQLLRQVSAAYWFTLKNTQIFLATAKQATLLGAAACSNFRACHADYRCTSPHNLFVHCKYWNVPQKFYTPFIKKYWRCDTFSAAERAWRSALVNVLAVKQWRWVTRFVNSDASALHTTTRIGCSDRPPVAKRALTNRIPLFVDPRTVRGCQGG